jgi:tripartite-type tricarboxylate transporter receptor subunit TctC
VAVPFVKEGTVRALAVTSKTRSQIFPDGQDDKVQAQ